MKHGEPNFHPGADQEHFDYTSHLAPISMYVGIWAALMVGTGLTVYAASIELGIFNIVVALLIATIKGTLVVLFFMHLRYSTKLTMVTVVAAIFFLLILFSLSMTDYLTRGWETYIAH
jgi:cytochrome c oxidase subunit 4